MRRTDPFSPLSLMTAFFVGGVLLPVYPFLNQEDGFTQFWQFAFSDRLSATMQAVLGYGLVMLCFAIAYIGFVGGNRKTPTPFKILRCLGFKSGRLPLSFYLLGAIATGGLALTIHLQGGFEEALVAASDRTRASAGMNFIVLLQNAYLSIGLAWALMLTNRRNRVSRASTLFFFALCFGLHRHHCFARCQGDNLCLHPRACDGLALPSSCILGLEALSFWRASLCAVDDLSRYQARVSCAWAFCLYSIW